MNNLSWSQYVGKLCSKLVHKIGILRRIKHKVPQSSLVTLYETIIQPHIDHC